MEILKKENILIAVAVVCIAVWYYRQQLNQNEKAQKFISFLPVIGGLVSGFNILITLSK